MTIGKDVPGNDGEFQKLVLGVLDGGCTKTATPLELLPFLRNTVLWFKPEFHGGAEKGRGIPVLGNGNLAFRWNDRDRSLPSAVGLFSELLIATGDLRIECSISDFSTEGWILDKVHNEWVRPVVGEG